MGKPSLPQKFFLLQGTQKQLWTRRCFENLQHHALLVTGLGVQQQERKWKNMLRQATTECGYGTTIRQNEFLGGPHAEQPDKFHAI